MKSLTIPAPERFFSREYPEHMLTIARQRLNMPGASYEEMLKAVNADCLEDLFILSYVSVDTGACTATLFYKDNDEAWCFEHMMYQTEDAHRGLHAVQS